MPVRRSRSTVGWYIALTALSLVILFPIYTTIIRAISSPIPYLNSIKSGTAGLTPVDANLSIFGDVLADSTFQDAMVLSVGVAALVVLAEAITSIAAAYAFVFMEFPFKRTLFALIMGTMLLPIEVTLIANIETIRDASLFNSILGLSAPFLVWAFGFFLLRQAFMSVPPELRDAAELDGYGHLRFLWKIVLPISRPMVGSFLLIAFLGAWNQYLWPRFAADRPDWQTIQMALRNLGKQEIDKLNFGFAAALLSALPLLVALIIFQRQLIRGLTAGAVKG
jgi:sn-glycerol 3-phosphate transport system permease protein